SECTIHSHARITPERIAHPPSAKRIAEPYSKRVRAKAEGNSLVAANKFIRLHLPLIETLLRSVAQHQEDLAPLLLLPLLNQHRAEAVFRLIGSTFPPLVVRDDLSIDGLGLGRVVGCLLDLDSLF